MRRALALTLTVAATAALTVPAVAGEKAATSPVLLAAEHEAFNQGDPLTESGQHQWQIQVQQVGGTFYAYAFHARRYLDPASGQLVDVHEETGGGVARPVSGGVVVDDKGTTLTVDVQLPFVRKTFASTPVPDVTGTTTLSGTWRRNGGADRFTFMGYDAVDDSCDGFLPQDLRPVGARSALRVFDQDVPEPIAKSLSYIGMATYTLPGTEGC